MYLHRWIRNLYEYSRTFFVDTTITGRNNQDSDSAAESDNDDNADDRWWLRR